MEKILQSLNLGALYGRFQVQKIETEIEQAAPNQELVCFGISTIRNHIRSRCLQEKIGKLCHDKSSNCSSGKTAVREEHLYLVHQGTTTEPKYVLQQEVPVVRVWEKEGFIHGRQICLFGGLHYIQKKHQSLWRNKFCSKLTLR